MFQMSFKKKLCCALFSTSCLSILSFSSYADPQSVKSIEQSYEANWASLDARKTPQWWRDAKFGIFIHWGLYSVPAYSPVGTYAEWYGERMHDHNPDMDGDPKFDIPDSDQVSKFHQEQYGESFEYKQFTKDFKAELFDPKHWANIFKRSGAKYVVLTSKHHEGYTLWPSEHASKNWQRPWNAFETGPKRDVLGDLTQAVREQGLKMGYYYSLYEWYNPIYKTNFDNYVDQHMFPQFKDLVERYNPSVIFADGEWNNSSADWRSEELLAWLFNRPNSDEVVINDRWGSETRHKHGGYYTTEYGAGLPSAEQPWEESRGMGTSYGYNRNENIDDYGSAQQLLLTLIDTVSRGGNFLLNIGPTGDGRIPVIMQDRLVSMGKWLDKNGAAIYGTTAWHKAVQWGAGEVPNFKVETHGFVDYDIIEQTLSPKPGQAAKEAFFTQKADKLFVIMPIWHQQLTLKDLKLKAGSTAKLLATNQTVQLTQKGNNLVLSLPNYEPQRFITEDSYAYVVEILRK